MSSVLSVKYDSIYKVNMHVHLCFCMVCAVFTFVICTQTGR